MIAACSLMRKNKAKLTEFTKLAHGLSITVEAELGVMASTGKIPTAASH